MSDMTTRVDRYSVSPGGTLCGEVAIPGDKSISHRAIMLSAIADGRSRLTGFLESADCLATLGAFSAMGIHYRRDAGALVIEGVGRDGLQAPGGALDLGNSGTSMRLLAGLMAAQPFDTVLSGDASLSGRPMNRVIEPLRLMGASVAGSDGGRAPLTITGGQTLHAIDYATPVASAQIKSCILLAGLYAAGTTRLREPGLSRDHTERMLGAFGIECRRADGRIELVGGQALSAADIGIPADLSSAAFFMVGATIAAGSDLLLPNIGVNPTRRGVIEILLAMGADITLEGERVDGGEPVADIRVRGAALRGVQIGAREVELAIDELPAVCIAAACAEGTTCITGAAELRVKESDRIAVMAEGLAALGVEVTTRADGMTISGRPGAHSFQGGAIDSHGDHRIAMAFAMAGLRASAPISIAGCGAVETSFPGFAACAASAGLAVETGKRT